MIPILFIRNLNNNPQRSSRTTGPLYRDSFRLKFVLSLFAEASYTMQTLVVSFASVSTA